MTLIHCAMLSEAIYLVEKLKLTLIEKTPKIYINKTIILLISGIGEENTLKHLTYIFKNYNISKAINIGIAGCGDKKVDIGSLFCTNHHLKDIDFMELKTVNTPQIEFQDVNTLYDMEAKYFEEISLEYLSQSNIFIYKIISDYLEDKELSKEFVKQLIIENISKLLAMIDGTEVPCLRMD